MFLHDFRVFEGPGGPRAADAPGRAKWGLRTEGAPGALLAVSWRSLGAVWSPGTSFSSLFSFPEALCFRALRHRSRNRHRLLVFSFGNFRSTWALALVSRAWACAVESCALARGSWALAWALALGSWALTLGFRLWGLRLFSSGASALSLL